MATTVVWLLLLQVNVPPENSDDARPLANLSCFVLGRHLEILILPGGLS